MSNLEKNLAHLGCLYYLGRFALGPPFFVFIVICITLYQWMSLLGYQADARTFYDRSEVVVFQQAKSRMNNGREYPVYAYQQGGKTKTYSTYKALDLPFDRRVRVGEGPVPGFLKGEIAIPLNGPDTVGAVYAHMRGRPIGDDLIKATVVTLGSAVVVVAGYFLLRAARKNGTPSRRRRR